MKSVIINADDYAMSQGIDDAIIDLAHKGVVTATTALVCSPRWPEAAKRLRAAPLVAGLHLDFTNAFAPTNRKNGEMPVKPLILRAWTRQLHRNAVLRSVQEQLDSFEAEMGRAPQIVDGHEHVHQFPVIREALVQELQRRYKRSRHKPLLRNTQAQQWRGLKAAIIGTLGSAALMQLAQEAGLPCSGDFAGVYNFAPQSDLPRLWKTWFERINADTHQGIIMCHPSYAGNQEDIADSIYQARLREAEWLASADFAELLSRCKIKPQFMVQ